MEAQGGLPIGQPVCPLVRPSDVCSETGGTHQLCMDVSVFIFCVLLSAAASGLAVSSRRVLAYLRTLPIRHGRTNPSRYDPLLKRCNASGMLTTESEVDLVKAAAAMDRAAASAPLEREDVVPPRFVRAFCGNIKEASQRWRATLAWRRENHVDGILNEPQPHFSIIKKHFPTFMFGRSKQGFVVVYEKLGKVDMKTMAAHGVTVPILLRHWIFNAEYMWRVVQPEDGAQQVTVEDVKGVRLQDLAGKILEYVQSATRMATSHYVERCHITFVVNAPAWFGLIVGIISPFIPPRTRQKIRILGSDMSPMHQFIDPEYIPVEYGGKNLKPLGESTEERRLRLLVGAINTHYNQGQQADLNPPESHREGSPLNGAHHVPARRHSTSQAPTPISSPPRRRMSSRSPARRRSTPVGGLPLPRACTPRGLGKANPGVSKPLSRAPLPDTPPTAGGKVSPGQQEPAAYLSATPSRANPSRRHSAPPHRDSSPGAECSSLQGALWQREGDPGLPPWERGSQRVGVGERGVSPQDWVEWCSCGARGGCSICQHSGAGNGAMGAVKAMVDDEGGFEPSVGGFQMKRSVSLRGVWHEEAEEAGGVRAGTRGGGCMRQGGCTSGGLMEGLDLPLEEGEVDGPMKEVCSTCSGGEGDRSTRDRTETTTSLFSLGSNDSGSSGANGGGDEDDLVNEENCSGAVPGDRFPGEDASLAEKKETRACPGGHEGLGTSLD